MHAQDGWYFARVADGAVRIEKRENGACCDCTEIPAEGWASVVASVSKGDEEGGRFYLALAFHNGTEIGCQCPIDDLHRLDCVLGINPGPVQS